MPAADIRSAELITAAAQRMIAYDSWDLVTAEQLVAGARQRLATQPAVALTPLDAARLCEQAAGELLHAACDPALPAEEQARQVAGYHDLGNYLTRLARRLPPPSGGAEWADLVQVTLVAVYQRHAQCHDPAAFLAWSARILRQKSNATWRKHRGEQSGGPPADIPDEPDGPPPVRPPSVTCSVDPLGDQELLRALRDCLDTDEERTLALCYFFGLKRRELGMIFTQPLTYWDELRRKVQKKLRNCRPLIDLLGPLSATA